MFIHNIILKDLEIFLSKVILIIFISYIYFYYNYSRIEKKHIQILRETSAECTLFLNKNNKFPIDKPCTLFKELDKLLKYIFYMKIFQLSYLNKSKKIIKI